LRANAKYTGQSKEFWANIRLISQEVGYTERGTNSIKIPTVDAIRKKFNDLGLISAHIVRADDTLTDFGQYLIDYFTYRSMILNEKVQNLLMSRESAEIEFTRLREQLSPKCPLPMNKQRAEKRNYAFFTGIINMLIEENIGSLPCDYNPQRLTTVTHGLMPLRTLSRRIDGAFPSVIDPIAVWEIKEYYYTTTFGSRVADGVYETLLDGMELKEVEGSVHRKVQHLLFIDDHFTWWMCGRSYLCRLIDMLHMNYVDEVIFGREVLTRLPELVREWKTLYEVSRG
jgi:hypothetical protein